jgi:RNA polymerase sigma-70 factor (ECF subfamily)
VDWFEPNFAAAIDGRTAAAALERLPEEQREVIVAHLWGGLTFEEIAEVTGASSSTAHRRYAEGLQTLRQELGVTWLNEHR